MRIAITKEHIDTFPPPSRDRVFNPLGFALNDVTGVLWTIDYDGCYPTGKDRGVFVPWPEEIYQWLENYDHNSSVHPIEFDLSIPEIPDPMPVRLREFLYSGDRNVSV